ncbi:MAG: heme-binding protein [Planctomycetia bacterium]|nr:heme-binding protein [Planctomycetia bacterium]
MANSQKKRGARQLKFEGLESRIALSGATVLTQADAAQFLQRASAASASQDAIIAIVDRGGNILGVRTEGAINTADQDYLVFAIDGAVAEARTAAFFSSKAAPLTSRTVRYISQSTITQREVESNPNIPDPNSTVRGPGFVAPIGVGGQFPPGIANTPLVDLFAIEHTNRDSLDNPGPDGIKGTPDDIILPSRFNVNPANIPPGQGTNAPESYGFVSGIRPFAQSRGIGTLPGGIPLYKNGILVGGIGVFFPGPNGYASFEQGFIPNVGQTSLQRTNAPRVLEAEWIAFAAAGGSSGARASVGTLDGIAPVPGYDLPAGRIDLAGITLQEVGPIAGPLGIQTILKVGMTVGRGFASGHGNTDQPIDPAHDLFAEGKPVPAGWLVQPHAGSALTEAQVTQIIDQGIAEAQAVRAQIRLPLGARTRMVLAVADKDGSVLGLFRMPDATVFSIDVAVAKARNTVYYADPTQVQPIDLVDDNKDGIPDVPAGTAFTNRTFRFLAAPNFPSGAFNSIPGAFSILRDPGINPKTAENVGPPRPASVYQSVLGFDSFHPNRNFHDPNNFANQNGVVFFPGSTPLYTNSILVGGFGVSGDGVDQDDVVTFFGAQGFQAPNAIRVDQFFVRNVRLPFQKLSRNPHA